MVVSAIHQKGQRQQCNRCPTQAVHIAVQDRFHALAAPGHQRGDEEETRTAPDQRSDGERQQGQRQGAGRSPNVRTTRLPSDRLASNGFPATRAAQRRWRSGRWHSRRARPPPRPAWSGGRDATPVAVARGTSARASRPGGSGRRRTPQNSGHPGTRGRADDGTRSWPGDRGMKTVSLADLVGLESSAGFEYRRDDKRILYQVPTRSIREIGIPIILQPLVAAVRHFLHDDRCGKRGCS
jgi:hypothetical protein